jgi:hypothetical protein
MLGRHAIRVNGTPPFLARDATVIQHGLPHPWILEPGEVAEAALRLRHGRGFEVRVMPHARGSAGLSNRRGRPSVPTPREERDLASNLPAFSASGECFFPNVVSSRASSDGQDWPSSEANPWRRPAASRYGPAGIIEWR